MMNSDQMSWDQAMSLTSTNVVLSDHQIFYYDQGVFLGLGAGCLTWLTSSRRVTIDWRER